MLNREFYLRDVNTVSKDLLGKLLVHETAGGILSGMIVETEAYSGLDDAAAHSYPNLRTARTEIQFHNGGYVYMYLIYGMHYCFNIVANLPEIPQAVLVRALEPVSGIDQMMRNRNTNNPVNLCNGPGKLCKALELNKSHYGADLCGGSLYIREYKQIRPADIALSARINVEYAGEDKNLLWRYTVKNNKYVSNLAKR